MRFSQALKELDLARHPVSPSVGIEMLMSAIAPFEPMFTRMEPASVKNEDSPAEFDLPASLRAFIPISESGVSPGANGGIAAEGTGANGNLLNSTSFSPKPEQQAINKERRGEEGEPSRPGQKIAGQKLAGPFEPLQILPSRRGQYKKKS
jgi:hypothetical protein